MQESDQIHQPSIEEVGDLLGDMAALLLNSGAHTMRIIQNIARMAERFGYQMNLSVFQHSVMMTLASNHNLNEHVTLVKKAEHQVLNFTIVSELSELSWETYDKHLDFCEIKNSFDVIAHRKRISRWLVLPLVGLANAAFCGLFGGDLPSMLLVLVATLAGFYVRQEMLLRNFNPLVVFTTSAFVASFIAGLSYVFGIGNTPQHALAASVLYLIPGVPLINSILDIIQGHVLTGISRLVNATALIVCIALGMFASMLIFGLQNL